MEKKFVLSLAGLLFFIVVIILCSNVYISAYPSSNKLVDFTIEKGQGAKEISVELKEQGIIKYGSIFRFYALLSGSSHKLQAGKYELSPAMDIAQIVGKFSKGDIKKQKITIIEGWTLKNIAKYLAEQGICSEDEFFALVQKDFNQGISILEDKPKSLNIEGYLFPNTYEIIPGTGAEAIIQKMISNLDKRITLDLREEILKQKKAIFDIITMASLIEKEVKSLEDKKIVAGILWKRLNIGMLLQVDATVVYITGKNPSYNDLQIDSPYNTYKYAGLPLGPISNPGLDSIIAAIYPTATDYFYYLSAPSGKTIFSKTFKDHNNAINKYLR